MKPRPLAAPLWIAALLLSSPAWSTDEVQGSCTPGPTTLCLLSDRFQVEIDWEDFKAQTGEGQVLPGGFDDTGFFWFADPLLVDNFVKVLDGTAANGHFWVFAASLTNVAYTMTVTDTVGGGQAVYVNPLGSIESFTDTMAIPDNPLTAVTGPAATSPAAPQKGAGGACVPGGTVLCLDQGRFQIEVDWEDFGGNDHSAETVQLTDNSGYMTFFDPSNVEMAAKIYDGGDGFYWFFAGSTTSVEYTITVTDTCSGNVRTYFSPLGELDNFGDFTAFDAGTECAVFTDGFESGDVSRWSSAVGD